MRLESVLFPSSRPERYTRMASVLAASAAINSPATPLTIQEINSVDADLEKLARQKCKRKWIDNARKAKHHNEIIQRATDGEVLGMIDADTMILGDLGGIESLDFDIAYTARPPEAAWKINTGVYFVRISERTKAFCGAWYLIVREMLQKELLHDHWRREKRYGGIHQAAFGLMIENCRPDLKLLSLPCEIWNCECSSIEAAMSPKVLHLMGRIREWVFVRNDAESESAKRMVETWKDFDRSFVVLNT